MENITVGMKEGERPNCNEPAEKVFFGLLDYGMGVWYAEIN